MRHDLLTDSHRPRRRTHTPLHLQQQRRESAHARRRALGVARAVDGSARLLRQRGHRLPQPCRALQALLALCALGLLCWRGDGGRAVRADEDVGAGAEGGGGGPVVAAGLAAAVELVLAVQSEMKWFMRPCSNPILGTFCLGRYCCGEILLGRLQCCRDLAP